MIDWQPMSDWLPVREETPTMNLRFVEGREQFTLDVYKITRVLQQEWQIRRGSSITFERRDVPLVDSDI